MRVWTQEMLITDAWNLPSCALKLDLRASVLAKLSISDRPAAGEIYCNCMCFRREDSEVPESSMSKHD